ncbi:transmembrane protein 126A [Polyergus mexicanus]|uniref:transmembrane protein 126A n=1 Tax=Polyergus mexicanus TaxID=615972 RepID=UPI0038B4F0EF
MEEAHQQRVRYEIPKGAVILSKIEALTHQIEVIRNWKPQSDVWSLIYGRPILSGAAALTGIYINQRFRRKLKLRNYGLFSTISGLITGPTIATSLLYSEIILNRLLLLEVSCPLCLESKSILLQICTGLLFPLILAPLANFSIAANSGLHNIPCITDTKGMFRIISSAYQPMIPILATIFTLHVLLAGFITHSQVKSFLYILDVQNLEKEQRDASNDL